MLGHQLRSLNELMGQHNLCLLINLCYRHLCCRKNLSKVLILVLDFDGIIFYAVYALMLMLLFPLSITISNETAFVLKVTVFESALFISTCLSHPLLNRASTVMSCWNVSELLVIFAEMNVLKWYLNEY